ncbi:SDR family NAD(P)-dependent oxidoreductase [Yaniella halotolerans]|uniref:SDR family NAD(P)-dependent oxidoreductase n=1 Tax=Yaniella halotolerans TaxID=225453 RepID=UPI0003B5DD07|nr:SDR family NAD(P)-dependent oxidoreductase [Yaniella halotolerans]
MNTAQELLEITDHLKALAVTNRQVVVVTGATGGIGRAIVEDLAHDYAIVAQGRDEARLAELASLGQQIYPVRCDLTETDALAETFRLLPKVDALINAAAIAPRFAFDDATAAIWSEVMHLNVTVPSELTRILLPQLRASTGTIVYLGSGASRTTSPHNVVYAASKHALQALADGVRMRTEVDRIRVATVAPGHVDTPMIKWEDDYPLVLPETLIQPATVARTIRHVIEAPADTQITEVWVRPRAEP